LKSSIPSTLDSILAVGYDLGYMGKKFGKILILLALTIIPVLLVWFPFFIRAKSFWQIPLPTEGMATIVSNFDGPLFLVAAKSLYNPEIIKTFPLDIPTEYYAAHFPLFPLLIRSFAFVFGYPYSMLFVTVLGSFLSLFFFNKLIKEFVSDKTALILTAFFAIFPARWLIVRSVGSPEPLFIGAIIASIYYFRKSKYWWAGAFGALAQLTKSPGILLFVAYASHIILPQLKKIATTPIKKWWNELEFNKKYPIFLIPLALIAIFVFYAFTYHNFWAYFKSGDNIHLFFPPFQIFNYSAAWVGTFWLEEVIFIYLIGAMALIKLIKQGQGVIAWFFGIFFVSILFVSHRDLMRYALPLVPFVFIAFKKTLAKKEFWYVLALIAIPIYLFTLTFISQNTMPIGNWAPFL
jgi:hypothetical protein